MLEVTSAAQEITLGVDFADVYKNSELHRLVKPCIALLAVLISLLLGGKTGKTS